MSGMDSTTAPRQETAEHETRISVAAQERRERIDRMEAEHAAIWPVVVKAVQHFQAVDEDHIDGIVMTFDALAREVRALPPELRDRLLKALPWG